MIEVSNFYRMKNDSLKDYGFDKGDFVYIAGSGFVPDSKSDKYRYRLVFVGVKVEDYHVKIGDKGFTVDAKNLANCSKSDLEILEANKEADFGGQAKEIQAN